MPRPRRLKEAIKIRRARILRQHAPIVIDSAVRENDLIRQAVPGDHLATRSAEEGQIGVRGAEDGGVPVVREVHDAVPGRVRDSGEVEVVWGVVEDEVADPVGIEGKGGAGAVCLGGGVAGCGDEGEAPGKGERRVFVQTVPLRAAVLTASAVPSCVNDGGGVVGDGCVCAVAVIRFAYNRIRAEMALLRKRDDTVEDAIETVAG